MSAKKMKALVKEGSTLAVSTVDRPQLKSDDEVLIQVSLAGLCRTDVYVANGKIPAAPALVLGHEFSGVVIDGGASVSSVSAGDKVTVNPVLSCGQCRFCLGGQRSICQRSKFIGIDRNGCFADFITVPASSVYRLPDQISFMAAAYAEPVAAALAVLKVGLDRHEKGLIYGKNRFSQLMLKILALYGFDSIATYDPSNGSDAPEESGFDFVIETMISTEALADLVRAVRPGGRVILKSRQYEPVSFTLLDVIKKEPVLHVVNYGSFEEALALLAGGKLQVEDLADGVYKLEDYKEVLATAQRKEALKPFFSPGEG